MAIAALTWTPYTTQAATQTHTAHMYIQSPSSMVQRVFTTSCALTCSMQLSENNIPRSFRTTKRNFRRFSLKLQMPAKTSVYPILMPAAFVRTRCFVNILRAIRSSSVRVFVGKPNSCRMFIHPPTRSIGSDRRPSTSER